VDREKIPDDKAEIGYFSLIQKHNQASSLFLKIYFCYIPSSIGMH